MTMPRRSSEPSAPPQVSKKAVILRGGFSVTPQLGRTQYLALIVEQDKTVLLAGNAQAEDVLAVDIGCEQRTACRQAEGLDPFICSLFTPAIGAADQRVRDGALA